MTPHPFHSLRLAIAAGALLALAACSPPSPPPAGADAAGATPSGQATASGTNAMAELSTALDALGGVRSYHATMDIEAAGNTTRSELDFVAPDRFRMVMPGLGTQTIIGDTMYVETNGQVMRMDVPAGALDTWRNPARLDDPAQQAVVQALGRETLDGQPTRKVLVRHQGDTPADVTMWIGPGNLPLQVQVVGTAQGDASSSLIRYSRFNDPSIRITPPQ